MRLFDSKIVIYAAKPEYPTLIELFDEELPLISAISVVEVMGYHLLSAREQTILEVIFVAAEILPITDEVIDRAVALRQRKRMKLGDAIIAATALVHSLELYTHNIQDFVGIPGLVCVDPLLAPT